MQSRYNIHGPHRYWIGTFANGHALGQQQRHERCGLSFGPYLHASAVPVGSYGSRGR
jgi:hypothetical protein